MHRFVGVCLLLAAAMVPMLPSTLQAAGSRPKAVGRTRQHGGRRALVRVARITAEGFKGMLVDGARDSVEAIRSNKLRFFGTLAATVAAATALDATGVQLKIPGLGPDVALTPHHGLIALSAAMAGVEVKHQLRKAKSGWPEMDRQAKARAVGRLFWSPLLVVGSALIGGAIGGHADSGAQSGAAVGVRQIARSAAGHFVTAGDYPTVLVTAGNHDEDDGADGAADSPHN